MPNLKTLLEATMPFTAARGVGVDLFAKRLPPGAPISVPEPSPVPVTRLGPKITNTEVIDVNPIWQWTHAGSAPARFSGVTCKVRGMGLNYQMAMPVLDSLDFGDIQVTLLSNGSTVTLPLQTSFLAMKFFLPDGKTPASNVGFWRLEANTDASLLLVFAFELAGSTVIPMSADKLDVLGSSLMPEVKPPEIATIEEIVNATIGPPRFIVAASLTCCKERPDFEAGGVLGAARIYPHVMVVSNTALSRIESTVTVTRPAKTMPHDPEMMSAIEAIFMEDTNTDHTITGIGPPLPHWNNFFDYYSLDPIKDFGTSEVTFVDRKKQARFIAGGIQRCTGDLTQPITNFYEPITTFLKVKGQGEFDNVHLAPHMQTSLLTPLGVPVSFPNIRMAPFCIHDCLHMHTRWGMPAGAQPAAVQGFRGDNEPYAVAGAPLVPINQSVYIKMTSPSSFRYRAVAEGPVTKGRWQCFMHHGMAYACDLAPNSGELMFVGARTGVEAYAALHSEPFQTLTGLTSIAAFYWRLRFGGFMGTVLERIKILDLALCRS